MDRIIEEFTDLVKAKERMYSYFIWNTAKRNGTSLGKQEIEDIISDAYLSAVTQIRNNPRLIIIFPVTWFMRVIYFRTLRYLKNKKRVKTFNKEWEELMATNFVYDTIDKDLPELELKALMEKLKGEERNVIEMNVQGLSYKEIAARLNKKEDNVRQIKSRAVKKLRKLLK
jgi:RNA polymerase sigma factor (sigma-70 family)